MKLVVFPTDPVESYARKGEVKQGYYNPGNFFDEIHIINLAHQDKTLDYSVISQMCGKAKCHIHYMGPWKPGNISALKKKIIREIQNIQPDAIRAYGLLFEGYFASRAARALNIPLVISLHDNYKEYFKFSWVLEKNIPKWLFFKYWQYFVLPSIVHTASYVIAVYPHAIRGVPATIRCPYQLIYNKVYAKRFKPIKVKKYSQFTAVTVGNLLHMKGTSVLLDVIHGTDVRLIILGQGPLKQQLVEKAKRNGVENQVEFIDSIPNKDLPAFYNKAHCFITAIRQGGIGIPMIESMACGLPIIHGRPMYIDHPDLYNGKNMLLVDSTQEALSKALTQFKNNTKIRQQYAKEGLKTFKEIEGKKMEKKEADVYRQVLKKAL